MIKLGGKIIIDGLLLLFANGITYLIFACFGLTDYVYVRILMATGFTSIFVIGFGCFIFIAASLVDWLKW